jgi:hypothetical protein
MLYVLGGSRASLFRKFKVAAWCYRADECARIVILHEPGNNEYDPVLRRNLTNDEWAIRELVRRGVSQEDVELLTVKPGSWGTLNEARDLAEFLKGRGIRRLILVTALAHTRRVRESFSCFLQGVEIELRVLATEETFSLRNLMVEYLKVTLYNTVLLPRNCGRVAETSSLGQQVRSTKTSALWITRQNASGHSRKEACLVAEDVRWSHRSMGGRREARWLQGSV